MNTPKRARHKYVKGYRFHEAADGQLYPGVTTVLGATKDNDFLEEWKDKLECYGHQMIHYDNMGYRQDGGLHPAIIKMRDKGISLADQVRDASTLRGNLLHSRIEDYLALGQETSLRDPSYNCFQLMKPLLDKLKGHVAHIEPALYNPVGYAGSADLIAEYQVTKSKRELAVFDWKNSRKPKKRQYIRDYILQVCAYIYAANHTLGLNIERGYVVVAVDPDELLQITNPGMVVQPELQIFSITPNQAIKGYAEFQERLKQFNYKLDNWF